MEVIVTGWRSTMDAWAKAHLAQPSELPALSEEQTNVAQKLGISAEEYARSFYAGELSKPELAEKGREICRLVESLARIYSPNARIERVLLETYRGLVRLRGRAGENEFQMEIEEDLVEEFMKGGSKELSERLERIIQLALPSVERQPTAS